MSAADYDLGRADERVAIGAKFTREDVALLRDLTVHRHGMKQLDSLADRIEAMLPPEDD